MGVFSERIFAILLVVPRRSRGASDGVRTHAGPDGQTTPAPMFMTGRECSPSSSVQRADFEALRAFCRVR